MTKHNAPVPLQYMPSNRLGDISFEGEFSLTKQSEAAACDINNIMSQYERTGLIPHVAQYQGQYADLGDSLSYHDSMNAVIAAQNAFDSLPANIRARFGNDPAAFLDFVNDDSNREEMGRMGLLDLPAGGVAETPEIAAEPPAEPSKKAKAAPPVDAAS